MSEGIPSLQRFITSLDERLEQMSAKEIRAAVLDHATELHGSQRNAFFSIFTTPSMAYGGEPPDTTWSVEDDPLLDEIDVFVADVASGKYFEGYGWDDELHDQRSFGDESWMGEMDDLFLGAQQAFLAAELGLARAAYQRLLAAFDLDQETGTFCGSEPAVELVQTDVPEAEARYLRAIYETAPAAERAATLADVWFHLPTWRPVPTLSAVRETRHKDLPAFERFLPAWIAELRSVEGNDSQVRPLLTEATELRGGIDGLAALARDADAGQAELFLDWIQGLRRADRDTEAVAAAREALQTVDAYGDTRAQLAEELAELLSDDPQKVLDARISAWHAAPTQPRLLAIHHAASATGHARQAMEAEVDALNAAKDLSSDLLAALLLLAGRVDDAVGLLGSPPGDQPPRSASSVLVPYLLAAGCAGPRRPDWGSTRLAALLHTVDQPGLWDRVVLARPDFASVMENAYPPLSMLLTEQIASEVNDSSQRSAGLEASLSEVGRQVSAIVSSKARGQYARAAHLLACSAEAITLAGDAVAGTLFLTKWRERYPRHTAFRHELDTAIEQASLLTLPTTRRTR